MQTKKNKRERVKKSLEQNINDINRFLNKEPIENDYIKYLKLKYNDNFNALHKLRDKKIVVIETLNKKIANG
ncbi:MAG TPA: hypothetical protein PKD00_01550 [Burkholderiales bacterium]|nr:hypothetical protein [Burkholderiales bacterium]